MQGLHAIMRSPGRTSGLFEVQVEDPSLLSIKGVEKKVVDGKAENEKGWPFGSPEGEKGV